MSLRHIHLWAILASLLLRGGSAAAYAGPAPSEFLRNEVTRAEVGSVNAMVPNVQRHLSSIWSSGERCATDYAELFAKPVVDVRLATGYIDWVDLSRPGSDPEATHYRFVDPGVDARGPMTISFGYNASVDVFMRAVNEQMLLSPCAGGLQACGFRRADATGTFEKDVRADGRVTRFRVALTHSSVSPFYELNTGPYRGQQNEMTASAERNFFGGLRSADVVLYHGHARASGGPDFAPVEINRFRHPDYLGYYGPRRPGVAKMRAALQARAAERGASPYFIGLFACTSRQHFEGLMRGLAPQSRLALTTAISDDANAVAVGPLEALDAIMRRQCPEQFQQSIALRPKDRTEIVLLEPQARRR